MTTLKQRIEQLEKELNLKHGWKTRCADICGVTQPSIQSWADGKSLSIGSKVLPLAAKFFGVNELWLNEGKGEKWNKENLVYRPFVAQNGDIDHSDSHEEIAMYDVKLSAGNGNAAFIIRKEDEPLLFRKAWFKQKRLIPDNCKGMYIRGNSMYPILNDWDTVLLDIADVDIVDGDVYGVVLNDEFYVKQIVRSKKGVNLVSYNDDYSEIEVTEDDRFQILGKMVWRGG